MAYPTGSPDLQAEFLQFLEQRLATAKEQLDLSEKEKGVLRSTLTRTRKDLADSKKELEALRSKLAAASSKASSKDDAASLALMRAMVKRTSQSLAAEEKHHMATGRALSTTESKLKSVYEDLRRLKATYQTLEHETRMQVEEMEKSMESERREAARARIQKVRALGKLEDAGRARDEALAARDIAIAAEKESRDQQQNLMALLALARNELSRRNLDKTSMFKGVVETDSKFAAFQCKMRALPAPPEEIDLCSLVPVKPWTVVSHLEKRHRKIDCLSLCDQIEKLNRKYSVEIKHFGENESRSFMWLPRSPHALAVTPLHEYNSGSRVDKWQESGTVQDLRTLDTCEILHHYEGELYYVGTYRLLLGPEDVQVPEIGAASFVRNAGLGCDLAKALADRTMSNLRGTPQKNSVAIALPEMYLKGIIRVQVVGFQCVGFNHDIDAELHGKAPLSAPTLNPAVGSDAPPVTSKRWRSPFEDFEEDSEEPEEPRRKVAKVY